MKRLVLPELLDVLPPSDAAAQRSRRDLRRVNAWMWHPQMLANVLQRVLAGQLANPADMAPPTLSEARTGDGGWQLVELGAGDGHFLWSVVRRLPVPPPGSEVMLVDRLDVFDGRLREAFEQRGWRVSLETVEAREWLRAAPARAGRVIVSNLFFHQFEDGPLRELLAAAAGSATHLIALEPRRSWLAQLGGRLLWVIGCGPVTRNDARISIGAGFTGRELSDLWPAPAGWQLTERAAGSFSHLFVARRRE